MRNEERIDIICNKINKYWHCVPDWRFLQLIGNLVRFMGVGDGYHIEDDEFEKKLDEFFAGVSK